MDKNAVFVPFKNILSLLVPNPNQRQCLRDLFFNGLVIRLLIFDLLKQAVQVAIRHFSPWIQVVEPLQNRHQRQVVARGDFVRGGVAIRRFRCGWQFLRSASGHQHFPRPAEIRG